MVIGVAASGRTPFTIAALKEAASRGAQTIGISNNPDAPILEVCSHPILADTGEEVIAGSTRMKAGTAQKVILNLLSTLIMVRLDRVYRGLMVNMRATNAKLRRRSEIMVSQITDCDDATAVEAIRQSGRRPEDRRAHRPRRKPGGSAAARSSATMAICAKPWQTSPRHPNRTGRAGWQEKAASFMGLGLGIDAGGTATRWRLADANGACVAQGTVAPLTGHLFSAAAEERARQIVLDMAQAVLKTGKPLGIIAGITGLTRDTPAEATMRALFAETFELPAGQGLRRRGHVDRLPVLFRARRRHPGL